MSRGRFVFRKTTLVLPILVVTGCMNTSMQDLERYVDGVKARPPGPIEPIPEVEQVETFFYMPAGRNDPFEPQEPQKEKAADEQVPGSGITPDQFRRQEELEAFPLDSIRMRGTLRQQDTMWGLVTTQDGVIHRVKVGNYMGQNHGQIMRISEEKIELTEIVPDGKGGYRERRASLVISGEGAK